MVAQLLKYLLNYVIKLKHKSVVFHSGSIINKNSKFEGHNSVGKNNYLINTTVGTGTYTGNNVNFSSVHIGRFCSIASNVKNLLGRHPVDTFVSTHPAFFSKQAAAGFTFSDEQLFEELKYVSPDFLVEIGSDVWIGENVTIFDNVKIGHGAIIGANSLVTKNIEPYSINVGVPAKQVKYRFDDETIKLLLKFEWWNKEFEWIKNNKKLFTDIELLKQHIIKNYP